MTRLIDADAFKKILSEHEMKNDKRRSFDDYDCGAANAYEHASDLLDDMPTVERPHGEWIDHSDEGYVECPFCDHATNCDDNIDELHYCFFCGAKMVKKEGEAE